MKLFHRLRKYSTCLLALTTLCICLFPTSKSLAQSTPTCASASSDNDGDGWGWENNRSCIVGSESNNTAAVAATNNNGTPVCSSASADPDNDGWGWENSRSCVVATNASASQPATSSTPAASNSGTPVCSSASFDQDNDGWGWENSRSCIVTAASNVPTNSTAASSAPAASVSAATTAINECVSSASDLDNDGWGFESGRSCQVTANSSTGTVTAVSTPGDAPPPVAAATGYVNGQPVCLTDTSDAGSNGFGYENDRTCIVVDGVTATRNSPLLNQRSCIPWLEIGYGNYRLQNNPWNSDEVYSNNWSQCIELTGGPGNYIAKWDYNWLDRNQGNEFAVKSYPQVYYGRKNRYNVSGTVAETGLPVSVNSMPQFWVEYNYSETGNVERNVAFESFFHTSCEAENYNKQYEMMVWVGVPKVRTPGTLVHTVTLSGEEWDVYTNPSLGWAYVAFVAKNPSTQGRLNWNDFVYWSRDVGPSYGVPSMARNVCMGAIELGTETFWGTGTFTLNRFRVNR